MSHIQIIRVGERSPTTVVRINSHDSVAVVPVNSGTGTRYGERWWQGEGPPPDLIIGAQVGDFYWDTITGDVFELNEGV